MAAARAAGVDVAQPSYAACGGLDGEVDVGRAARRDLGDGGAGRRIDRRRRCGPRALRPTRRR